ncbi:hypothetical protein ACWOWW_004303 [Vibrio vulnificus]
MIEREKQIIRKFGDDVELWTSLICEEFSVVLSCEELMISIITENKTDLLEAALANWNYEQCRQWYKSSQLLKRTPIVEEVICLDSTVLPNGVERAFLEEQIKYKGERWVVHKNDADPFPSTPHAHNYETMLKLHLGNGDLYYGTRKVGKIKKKDFIKLRGLFKKTRMPQLEI